MDIGENELSSLLVVDLKRYFKQIVLHYQDQLYTFVVQLTGNVSDAEDIVQDAFIGAYITLTQYPSERIQTLKLRPWLYKIALNIFRNSKRGKQLFLIPLDQSLDGTLQDQSEENPDTLYEITEQHQELEALLATLPVHYRTVITCYYFEELSYQEIADLLDQPIGTTKSRLHRGVQMIRQKMLALKQERNASYGAF